MQHAASMVRRYDTNKSVKIFGQIEARPSSKQLRCSFVRDAADERKEQSWSHCQTANLVKDSDANSLREIRELRTNGRCTSSASGQSCSLYGRADQPLSATKKGQTLARPALHFVQRKPRAMPVLSSVGMATGVATRRPVRNESGNSRRYSRPFSD